MASFGPQRLYDLLDTLVVLRIEYAEGAEGEEALAILGRAKAHAVRTCLDTAITNMKRIIGEMERPLPK